jgi:DnaK suppressor protein
VRHAEKERDQQELQQIEGARERMRQGSYGECVDCGAAIALARLRALPSAERCIPCQEMYEQGHSVMPPILPRP